MMFNQISSLFLLPLSVADCKNNTASDEQKQLALLVMETLTVLLQGFNNTNAGTRLHLTLSYQI